VPEDRAGPGGRRPIDPQEWIDLLARDLRVSLGGLSSREAERRLLGYGPNRLERRAGRRWPGQLARQFTHPLALLLWGAVALAAIAGITAVAIAILIVVLLNAAFAFAQEMQAERAVEALQGYLSQQARVLRDGREVQVDAAELVPGDLLLIAEGDRISAPAHLVEGTIEADLSTLTGESVPVSLGPGPGHPHAAAAGARARLQRHRLHWRRGAGAGLRDRDGDRAGPDRLTLGAGRGRGEPARAPGAAPAPDRPAAASVDVGTETLPALALGQEAAEPGIMGRRPRPRSQGIITRPMLVRAYLFLGRISAALGMGAFFFVLLRAGWSPNDRTGAGSPLHHSYQQATTMTFLSMVACQVGTAFAARTERASLRSVGVFSNRLLWGIAFELALTGFLIYVPFCQDLLGTAALPWHDVLLVVPFPFIVWGADELRRWLARRRLERAESRPRPALSGPRP
jgi:magnesium-transporting ATPase (P-type)